MKYRKNLGKAVLYQRKAALCLILALLSLLGPVRPLPAQAPNNSAALNKLAPALRQAIGSTNSLLWFDPLGQKTRVLIQANGSVPADLLAAITMNGGLVVRRFTSIDGLLAEVPSNALPLLAARDDVERISPDHLAQQSGSHLEAATTTDQVRRPNLLGLGNNGPDGSGIGIAVLDSGLMAQHQAFTNAPGLSRVVAATDIAAGNSHLANYVSALGLPPLPLLGGNPDRHGHGTHVAALAAGRVAGSGSERGFNGVAPGAQLKPCVVMWSDWSSASVVSNGAAPC